MGLATFYAQTTLRQRWRGYVGVALLLGLTGGLSLFAIAGARRTQSSYPRFLRSANASTVSLTSGTLNDARTNAAIAALPEVAQSRVYVSFDNAVLVNGRPDFSQEPEVVGTPDGRYFDQDRFAPTQGRLPHPARANEAAVNEFAAKRYGYRVGQRIELGLYTQEQYAAPAFFRHPPRPKARRTVTIVGIGLFPDEVLQDDGDRTTRLLVTPAFTDSVIRYENYSVQGLVLEHGDADLASLERHVARLVPPGTSIYRFTSDDEFHALQALKPLSIALGLFGAIAGIAGLVLVMQALTRLMRLGREERAAIRAFGAAPGAIGRTAITGPFLAIITGTALAVLLAVAASPLMPIGPSRKVDVSSRINLDITVLGLGALIIVAVLFAVTAAVAWREMPHRLARRRRSPTRPSRVVAAAAAAGMGPAAVTGVRLALEPGDTSTAVSVRSVMAGAAIAIVALVASVTFGASLSTLVHRPRLYGWDWNATFIDGQGYGNIALSKAHAILDQDGHVAAWSGAYFGSDRIAGHDVPLLGMDPGSVVTPPILQGRPIDNRSEAVLGGATAAALDKTIGDKITLAGGGNPHVVRIVGIATLPTIGIVHGGRTSLGVGVIVGHQLVPGYDRDITNTKRGDFGPNAIFIRYQKGTQTRAEDAKLHSSLSGTADFAGSDLLATQRPAEIVNSSSIGNAPVLLAAALAVGAMVSLGLAIGTSVRRRHKDFVLLKTLGFTRRQLARTVSWQATTTIAVGLLIGIPVGIAVGRELWYLFAARLYVVPEPTVPVLAVVGVAVAAVALANAVAVVPARAARRVNASPSSQTE